MPNLPDICPRCDRPDYADHDCTPYFPPDPNLTSPFMEPVFETGPLFAGVFIRGPDAARLAEGLNARDRYIMEELALLLMRGSSWVKPTDKGTHE